MKLSKAQQKAKAALARANSGEVEVLPPLKVHLSEDESATLEEHEEKVSELLEQVYVRLEDAKKTILELGWRLLCMKKAVGHGNFMAICQKKYPGHHPNTFTNYTNAALNCGLSENSQIHNVVNLVEKESFKHKLLTDLYRSPKKKTKTLELPNPDRGVDKENRSAKASMAFQRIVDVMTETKILWPAMNAGELKELATLWSNGLQTITQRKIVLGEPL